MAPKSSDSKVKLYKIDTMNELLEVRLDPHQYILFITYSFCK